MRFPQAFIDELRRQADLVRLIQDYVTLKKRGSNWLACCPFHQEKTPSFTVSPAKGMFYCFGCHKGGSVFDFIMEIESASFFEAVRIVADKSGMPIPVLDRDKRHELVRLEADDVVTLNRWALEWWQEQLLDGTRDSGLGYSYLESRGISDETQRTFCLGYAPDIWDGLSTHLKQRGAGNDHIERSGLVVKKETGGFYDRFRGRIMFPIFDNRGRPVAFGGRALPGKGEPKYLNSPETAAYVKGRHLFGINLARDEIRRQGFAILVEGYFDLIAPYQFGIRNVVASLGTALTSPQAKLLARFTRKIVVNYDGDSAGIQAAKRAIEVLLPEQFDVKILTLPDNRDPDEFVRNYGAEEYKKKRGEAYSHIHFVLQQAVRGRNLRDPAEKAAAVQDSLPFLGMIKDPVQRREYFEIAMGMLRIEDAESRQYLWKTVRNASKPDDARLTRKLEKQESIEITFAEQRLLELLLIDDRLRNSVLSRLDEDDYHELETAPLFEALIQMQHSGAEVRFDNVSSAVAGNASLERLVPALLLSANNQPEPCEKDELLAEAERCISALRLIRVDRRLKELANEITVSERNGEEARRNELIIESINWNRRRSALLGPGQAKTSAVVE